jgi:archaemetzincin
MRRIYLAPFQGVDRMVLDVIDGCVRRGFAAPTGRCGESVLPPGSFVPARRQHDSAILLRLLVELAPADALKILGVTEEDLGTPVLSFVFGQAQLDGPAAVISLARLRQEFHGLPPNRDLLLARACKEARHELGHTFGLVHCGDFACAMSLSTTVRDVDLKDAAFCPACREQLAGATRAARERAPGPANPREER